MQHGGAFCPTVLHVILLITNMLSVHANSVDFGNDEINCHPIHL